MNQKISNEELFLQLVLQNQQMAMISMGKTPNPLTQNFEPNLEFAKITIDMLDMIVEKTKGNLSDYESKLITEVIRNLKLNYTEASKSK